MNGYQQFQRAIMKEAKERLIVALRVFPNELAEATKNTVFNLPGPRNVERPQDPRNDFYKELMQKFMEVSKSRDTLEDIRFYIRRFPFQGTRITRERYLQFHVESYFSEIYLLRERITALLKFLERRYKRDPRLPSFKERCDALTKTVTEALDNVIEVRRQHVHETRFSDEEIELLPTIKMLSDIPEWEHSKDMAQYYRAESRKVKKIWSEKIRTLNSQLDQLLEMVFKELLSIVFDGPAGSLRYPAGLTSRVASNRRRTPRGAAPN